MARCWRCSATQRAECISLYFSGDVTKRTRSAQCTSTRVISACRCTTLSISGVSTGLYEAARRGRAGPGWPPRAPVDPVLRCIRRAVKDRLPRAHRRHRPRWPRRPRARFSTPARALIKLDFPTAVGPHSITTRSGSPGRSSARPGPTSISRRPVSSGSLTSWRLCRRSSHNFSRSRSSAGSAGVPVIYSLPQARIVAAAGFSAGAPVFLRRAQAHRLGTMPLRYREQRLLVEGLRDFRASALSLFRISSRRPIR